MYTHCLTGVSSRAKKMPMPDVQLILADEHKNKTKEELSILFDQEIERFSKFMATLGDWRSLGPLNNGERMLLKTFLVQKYNGKLDGEPSPGGR